MVSSFQTSTPPLACYMFRSSHIALLNYAVSGMVLFAGWAYSPIWMGHVACMNEMYAE
jgi:hypothetical protein